MAPLRRALMGQVWQRLLGAWPWLSGLPWSGGRTDTQTCAGHSQDKAWDLGRDPALLLGRRGPCRVPSPLTPHVTPRMSPAVSNVL